MSQVTGNPNSYPAKITLLDDSYTPTASNLNTGPTANADRTANLNARLLAQAAMNWSGAALMGGTSHTALCWAPLEDAWVVATLDASPHIKTWAYWGTDDPAVQIGDTLTTANSYFTALHADLTHAGIVYGSLRTLGPSLALYKVDTGGSSTWGSCRAMGASYDRATFAQIGDVVVAAVGGSDAAHTGLSYSSDQGGTWTDVHYGDVGTCTSWVCESNGAQVVAIPIAVGATSYLTSATGTAWTVRAFDPAIVGLTDAPTALAWFTNPLTGTAQWCLAVLKAAGGTTFYTSLDGITWVTAGSLPTGGGSFGVQSLAGFSSLLVATTPRAVDGSARLLFSWDGAQHWYYSRARFRSDTSHLLEATVKASGVQLLAANSDWFRITYQTGIGAVQV